MGDPRCLRTEDPHERRPSREPHAGVVVSVSAASDDAFPPEIRWPGGWSKHLVQAAVALALFVGACGGEPGEEYLPLRVGEECDYTLTLGGPGGTVTGKARSRTTRTAIAGRQYHRVAFVYDGLPGAEPDVWYYRRSANGIHGTDDTSGNQREMLMFPFPVEVDFTWSDSTTVASGEAHSFRARIEAIEAVELFARTYDHAVRVSDSGRRGLVSWEGTQYYARNVGIVKSVFKFSNGLHVEQVLEKCTA